MLYLDGPFHSITNFTKSESPYRAAVRAITGCLAFSSIPLLLSEASLPPLRVTLTHFALSFYKRAIHLPNFPPISSLAILGSETKTLQIFLQSFLIGELLRLLTCLCFLIGPFFLHAFPLLLGIGLSSLRSPFFPSHAPALISLFRQGAALAQLDDLNR